MPEIKYKPYSTTYVFECEPKQSIYIKHRTKEDKLPKKLRRGW